MIFCVVAHRTAQSFAAPSSEHLQGARIVTLLHRAAKPVSPCATLVPPGLLHRPLPRGEKYRRLFASVLFDSDHYFANAARARIRRGPRHTTSATALRLPNFLSKPHS